MRFRFLCLLIFLLLAFGNVPAEGYEIHFTIPSFAHDTMVLGHRFNANFIPQDTVIADSRGSGTFTGDASLPEGMYLVYLPDQSFFDLLIGKAYPAEQPDMSYCF